LAAVGRDLRMMPPEKRADFSVGALTETADVADVYFAVFLRARRQFGGQLRLVLAQKKVGCHGVAADVIAAS
jgi:hypothetical protein